jgi:PAS domain S-box-containing protein
LAELHPLVAYHDGLGEVFFALDRDWRIVVANGHALGLVRRTKEETLGRSYWEVVPHARGGVIEEMLRRAAETGRRASVEVESRFRPGVLVDAIAVPLVDGLAVAFRDISRARADASERARELASAEERFALAAEAASIGTWDVDVTAGTRRWSPQFRRILGVSDDAKPDTGLFSSLIHPDDRAWVNALYRAAYAGEGGGRYAAEFRIRRASDGEERWVSTQGHVYFGPDGAAMRGIGVLVDVTERKRREQALRESEERFRLAADAFQGGVFDVDVATGHVFRTDRHYALVGEAPGAIPPDRHAWYARIHPDDRPAFLAATQSVYEGEASQYEAEYRALHRDGHWVWIWHRALALRDGTGKLCRVVGSLIDVTDRRRAEERQLLLVAELNHRVKNTLATVQSIAAYSLRGRGGPAEARAAFEERLFALARAHDVLTREHWEGAELGEIVAQAVEPFGAGGRFRIEGPPVRLSPRAALAFAMALQELATNAAKYGALSVPAGRIEIAWNRDGSDLRFRWTETNGPAVAAPQRRGFGLALIERSLAQDLDGEAAVAFEPGGVECRVRAALC